MGGELRWKSLKDTDINNIAPNLCTFGAGGTYRTRPIGIYREGMKTEKGYKYERYEHNKKNIGIKLSGLDREPVKQRRKM